MYNSASDWHHQIMVSRASKQLHLHLAGTFHATAARFLRKHVSHLPKCGRNSSFKILGQDESIDTMTSILKEKGLAPLERRLAAGEMSSGDFKAALRESVSSVSSVGQLH